VHVKPSYLIRGLPGHPTHPPLTDATIGIYTFATIMAIVDAVGLAEENAAKAWWLALIVGLIATLPTALTGLFDWLTIRRGTPLFRTATIHALVNVTATILFALAALVGYDGYKDGDVTAGALVLTLLGFGALTVGGWLGGTIVYVHGMRVLNLVDEPTHRAAAPVPHPEKEMAEGG
jgi:uncharacterized membrane protein